MTERPMQCTGDAARRGRLEDDDSVGPSEAHVERSAVVPVDDPLIRRDKFGLYAFPLVTRRLDPPRLPEVGVEMYDGKRCPSAQLLSEGRLPRTTRSHYRHTLHTEIIAGSCLSPNAGSESQHAGDDG